VIDDANVFYFFHVFILLQKLVFMLFYLLINVFKSKKVKSNYFIVRPKVDQRAGLLSFPHFGILPFTRANFVFIF